MVNKTGILHPYPFPTADWKCCLHVTLYRDHLSKGGGTSL